MEQQQSVDLWPKMDMVEGQVKTYFQIAKNDIFTQEYSFNFGILISIFYSIVNPISLILITTLVVTILVPETSPYCIAMYATELALIVLANIAKRVLISKTKMEADERINQRTAQVFRGNQSFEKLEWGNIRQGDIVYLCQGDAAPADIIILDSQQIQHREAITYVDVKRINGETTSEKKKACYLTQILNRSSNQKRVWQEYKKILTGRITYEKASSSMESFTGYLKLVKDPKMEKLSIQNVVLRESIIKTSLWVYGLVIYPGMDSKVMRGFREGNKCREHIFTKDNKHFLLLILLNVILGGIFSAIYFATGKRYLSGGYVMAYHCLMFSVIFPYLKFLAKDLYVIILKCSNKINEVDIRDYENLQKLGEVSYAVISNVGVLTAGKLEVNQIATESSIYTFEEDEANFEMRDKFEKNTKNMRRRFGSSSRNDSVPQQSKQINNKLLLPIFNYDRKASALVFKEDANDSLGQQENFQIDDDTNVRIRQSPQSSSKISKLNSYLEPLKLDKNRFYNYVKRHQNESVEIIKALSFCHQAKLYYVANKDKYMGVSNVNSQEVLLKLVNYVGWNIIPKTVEKKQVGLTIVEQKEKLDEESGLYKFETIKRTYNWVGINSFHIQRKLFSVVVQHDNKNTLYCKGKPEDIIERLKISKQTQKIIQQAITSYSKKQSEVIIYAKREISEEEKQIYENDYVSLKSSLTTSEQQVDEFSKRYQKNLDFVCIIGLSTQMNPQADPLIKYIRSSDIKPCIFVQENTETASIKRMIMEEDEIFKDIEFEGQSAELIKYYLNEATNLIQNDCRFKYIITVNGSAWKVIQTNSQVMQHFMFVLSYSQAVLAIKFSPDDIRQFTHKIKNSYPKQEKVLGIGYSYSDLKFLGECDISISTCQDLPTDIKVDSLGKITQALKLGPYFLKSKLCRLSIIYYRVISIITVTLIYEAMMATYGASRAINGFLVFFYLILYTILELCYNFFIFRTPYKNEDSKKYNEFRKARQKYYVEYGEAFFHGAVIMLSLYFNLSEAKFKNKYILQVQILDLSVFITLILVGVFRNFFNKSFTMLAFIITSLITFIVIGLCLFFASLASSTFYRVYTQFFYIFSTYDAVVSIINCTIFCLGVSLFLQEIIKKHVLSEGKRFQGNKQNQTIEKKSMMINLIKHLYQNEDNMDSSVEGIVQNQLDVNRLKINKFLQIKKQEDDLKFLSLSIPKSRINFIKLTLILSVFYIVIFVLDITFLANGFNVIQIVLLIGFVISALSFLTFTIKQELFLCIFKVISILMIIFTTLIIIYCFNALHNYGFLIICLFSVAITMSININFFVLVFLLFLLVIIGIVIDAIRNQEIVNKVIHPLLEVLCILINFKIYYQVQLSSRISFVKSQTFEKESNYVNDILSILVPKFIKNHLEGNEFALQQQQKKVSILFCYVCNFDQIVKEEGTNVVPLMDELFRQFDQLCHNFAVQKIETVGQTYMAATGIKSYENEIENEMKKKNQVERLLKMAIQMLQKSKDIMWGTKKNKKLNLKIGIHHGNVIIGVIGFHKPQFSLIGDAVNTTSRHCSTAGPGEIVISSVAYQLLKKFPASAFTKSTKVMKGLGQVPIYRYNNNLGKQENHMKLRIKFQNAVKKVIQNLKAEGKINYKKFRASQLVERVMMRQRASTKKGTKVSEGRRSIDVQNFDLGKLESQNKQNKYSDLCLKYNKFMELQQKNSKFKKHLITKYQDIDRVGVFILGCIYLVSYLADIATKNYKVQSLALSSLGLIIFPLIIILYRKSIKHRTFNIAFVVLHAYLILVVNLKSIIIPENYPSKILTFVPNYYQIMAVIVCSSQKSFRFLHTLSLAIFSILVTAIVLGVNKQFDLTLVYQVFIYALVLIRKYENLKEYYDNYSQSQIDQKKTQQISALVSQLLPKHAYEKLKNQNIENKLELTDRFEGATILFADIKGFTAYSNKNTPAAVVKMLRQLFQEFDKLCLKYNVYKVYTIGDCYVVLGFTNCYQRDFLQEAKNVVNMGFAMVETIQRVREALDFQDLDMRIGVHTGTIIGGIIGTEIVRYDIYGPDVMVANKFEEFGKTGFIHISESTKEILDQDKKKCFNIAPNGTVKIQKLNAEYNGYILTKKKFEL